MRKVVPMTRKPTRSGDTIRQEMDGVCAEIAEIALYLEGSLQHRDATYQKKDGTLARHKSTPSLQYPTIGGQQGRMRIPWAHVTFVKELLQEGTRRQKLLARHRDLARELTAVFLRDGGVAEKKTPRSPLRRTLRPASAT